MKLNDIVKKYIVENKKNTFLIIVSIIISTAFYLFMNIISEDARNLMIDQAKKELGINHASYYDPTNKDIDYLNNNYQIEKLGKTMLLGLHDIGNSQTLHIISEDKNAQQLKESYKLKEGKFPVNENEIAIDKWYLEQKNIKNPIGKNIKLDYVRSDEKGKILYKGEKEFKITGILNSSPILKAQGTSIGFISEKSAQKNIPIKNKYDQLVFNLKKEKNIEKQVENIVREGNLKPDNIRLNNPLLSAMSDSISLKIPYIIVNMILALATILLIYNIFYILVSNRTKDFGVLRALGFIPSDVSKMMIIEVFIYSVIGIPIGLLIGGIVANLSREYIIGAIYNVAYVNSIKNNSYTTIYIVSSLLSILTIIVSVVKPLIVSSKIDPIICMKKSEEKVSIKENSFINKIMTKTFKDYGNIATKNLQRNKKRTNIAIGSMSIVIFLSITVYTKATSNFLNDDGLRYWIPGEYLIHNINIDTITKNEKSYDTKILNEIKRVDGIKEVNAYRQKWVDIKINEKDMNKESKYWKENIEMLESGSIETDDSKLYSNSFELMGIEETSILDDVLLEGKVNLSKLNEEPYIYIDKQSSKDLNLKMGDKLNLDFDIRDYNTGEYKETISKEFIVGGIINSLPLTSQAGTSFGAVISTNQFNNFLGVESYERFDIWTSKLANNKHVERELNKIINKSGNGILIPYKSESAGIEKSDNQKNMIMVLVIGVIVILSLFNCCNTMVTSINSRVREFALFRGIGISKDEIKKIVRLEGVVYILLSFSISIIPSLIIRYITINEFSNIKIINVKFIMAIIIICISLFIITVITIESTLKHIQREDFIEQIKTLQ